jgi:hypothetical protein
MVFNKKGDPVESTLKMVWVSKKKTLEMARTNFERYSKLDWKVWMIVYIDPYSILDKKNRLLELKNFSLDEINADLTAVI